MLQYNQISFRALGMGTGIKETLNGSCEERKQENEDRMSNETHLCSLLYLIRELCCYMMYWA